MDKKLEALLTDIINDDRYFTNKNLINFVSGEFTKNKLSRRIMNQLFMGDLTLEQLSNLELMCLLQSLYNYEEDKHKPFENLKPENFFSNGQLNDLDSYLGDVSNEMTQLVFKDVIKITDRQWVAKWSYEDIYKSEMNHVTRYNFDSQREAKPRSIGTKSNVVRNISYNQKSVDEIADEMYEGKFIANLVTLNVLEIEGKTPRVEEYDDGTLVITPDDNRNDKYTTFIDKIDGQHRIMGVCKAMQRAMSEGKTLEGSLIASINIIDLDTARALIRREQKQNKMSKAYLNTLDNSNELKFVKSLVKYKNVENILNDNVLNTFDETKAYKKLTYYNVLTDAIKMCDINVKSTMSSIKVIPKLITFINMLMECLEENKENNKLLMSMNIWIGYIASANKYKDLDTFEMANKVQQLAEKLNESETIEELNKLGLNNKNYNTKEIYNYFYNLI